MDANVEEPSSKFECLSDVEVESIKVESSRVDDDQQGRSIETLCYKDELDNATSQNVTRLEDDLYTDMD